MSTGSSSGAVAGIVTELRARICQETLVEQSCQPTIEHELFLLLHIAEKSKKAPTAEGEKEHPWRCHKSQSLHDRLVLNRMSENVTSTPLLEDPGGYYDFEHFTCEDDDEYRLDKGVLGVSKQLLEKRVEISDLDVMLNTLYEQRKISIGTKDVANDVADASSIEDTVEDSIIVTRRRMQREERSLQRATR